MGSNTDWRGLISPEMAQAQRELEDAGGPIVSVPAANNSILKFGKTTIVTAGQYYTVWSANVQNETYSTTNDINTISCMEAADVGVLMRVIGTRIASGTGGDTRFERVRQNVITNGQNAVLLDTPLARCSRMFVNGTDGLGLTGDAYISTGGVLTGGVPVDTAIRAKASAQDQGTQTTLLTITDGNYLLIEQIGAEVLSTNNANCEFLLQTRRAGGVFRTRLEIGAGSGGGTASVTLKQPIAVAPNTDIRIIATSSANNTRVAAFYGGNYAAIRPGIV